MCHFIDGAGEIELYCYRNMLRSMQAFYLDKSRLNGIFSMFPALAKQPLPSKTNTFKVKVLFLIFHHNQNPQKSFFIYQYLFISILYLFCRFFSIHLLFCHMHIFLSVCIHTLNSLSVRGLTQPPALGYMFKSSFSRREQKKQPHVY